jgi:hypothetical protein
MLHGAGWFVFAVESGTPRELDAAEDEIVNQFSFRATKSEPERRGRCLLTCSSAKIEGPNEARRSKGERYCSRSSRFVSVPATLKPLLQN